MPSPYLIINNWSTTLAGSITAGATSLTLASVAGLPTYNGDLVARIGNELLVLPYTGSTVFSGVTRGAGSTSPAAHAGTAAVTAQLDQTTLDNLIAHYAANVIGATSRWINYAGAGGVQVSSAGGTAQVNIPRWEPLLSAGELVTASGDVIMVEVRS